MVQHIHQLPHDLDCPGKVTTSKIFDSAASDLHKIDDHISIIQSWPSPSNIRTTFAYKPFHTTSQIVPLQRYLVLNLSLHMPTYG